MLRYVTIYKMCLMPYIEGKRAIVQEPLKIVPVISSNFIKDHFNVVKIKKGALFITRIMYTKIPYNVAL